MFFISLIIALAVGAFVAGGLAADMQEQAIGGLDPILVFMDEQRSSRHWPRSGSPS